MEANYAHKDSTTLVQDRFMKNGVFSLEYDKETLRDIVLELQEENKILRKNAENNDKVVDKVNWENMLLKKENQELKEKISKIETLIINHNCDTGDIYYKYNSKFLKSELKQRILEILEDKEV